MRTLLRAARWCAFLAVATDALVAPRTVATTEQIVAEASSEVRARGARAARAKVPHAVFPEMYYLRGGPTLVRLEKRIILGDQHVS